MGNQIQTIDDLQLADGPAKELRLIKKRTNNLSLTHQESLSRTDGNVESTDTLQTGSNFNIIQSNFNNQLAFKLAHYNENIEDSGSDSENAIKSIRESHVAPVNRYFKQFTPQNLECDQESRRSRRRPSETK